MVNVAIVGAGPYGLSVAAHLRRRGISFRIFGRLMDSWLNHMPKGMMLKSDGFASNIYDPNAEFTLQHFCAERGIEYADSGLPVHLDTFVGYGKAFCERMLPELEDKQVVHVERTAGGFLLRLDNAETVTARRVVLAVGITHFEHIPECLANLPSEVLTHSYTHPPDPTKFKGKSVAVIGGGASAIDLAALLHEAGVKVTLIARQPQLKYHSKPTGKPRSLFQQFRHPKSGLGPGVRSRFFSDYPMVFYRLPKNVRITAVENTLGPSAGWFVKDKMADVPCLLGHTPQSAELTDGGVCLHLRSNDGKERLLQVDHVVAATGYKVKMDRMAFLSPEIRAAIQTIKGSPELSPNFESSVPGLYFVGLAAAYSFGPVMRFAFGAGYAARRVSQALGRVKAPSEATVKVSGVAASTE